MIGLQRSVLDQLHRGSDCTDDACARRGHAESRCSICGGFRRGPQHFDPGGLTPARWHTFMPYPVDATSGELANPGTAYRDANGRLLMGPCETPGCPYVSKPGGAKHDGECR